MHWFSYGGDAFFTISLYNKGIDWEKPEVRRLSHEQKNILDGSIKIQGQEALESEIDNAKSQGER